VTSIRFIIRSSIPYPERYGFRDETERMFESKDKDLDGRLSFEEFMGEQSRAERLFKIMDKDGDGFVTKNVSFECSW
jgi:Ca2+-binding EF-hand superfamily protein